MNTYDNFFCVDVLELKTLLEKEKMLLPKQQGRTQHMLQVTDWAAGFSCDHYTGP